MRYVPRDGTSLGVSGKNILAASWRFVDGSCTCLVNRPKNILPDIDECAHMEPSAASRLLLRAAQWVVSESRNRRRREFWCLLCCWPSGSFSTGSGGEWVNKKRKKLGG